MPAMLKVWRFGATALPEPLTRRNISGFLAAAGLALATAVVPVAQAAEFNPIVMVVMPDRDGKPTQQVVDFRVAPDAARILAAGGRFVGTEVLTRIGEATRAHDAAALAQRARDEGWSWFALSAGWIGAAGTFAEHAVNIGGLAKINNALTNTGGALALVQVGIDLSRGDTQAASIDALKGLTGFSASKFGSSAIQIGGVAFFIFDVTLTSFGNAAWSAREDAWRQVYQKYYREMDATQGAPSGASGSLTERFRAIRARSDGGRSLNDWKVVAAFYFKNAKTPQKFEEYLNADVAMYAAKFWTSPDFLEHAADGDWSTAGIARGASLTEAIKNRVEAEHADAIRAMLVTRVLPELQLKAIEETLKAQAADLNKTLKPVLNQPVTIELSAYDLKAPTSFEVVKPNGGSWKSTLTPGQPRQLQISKIAYMLAGFPDTVRLLGPGGAVEKRFTLVDDKASVVFGEPASTLVTEMTRSESALDCTFKVAGATGDVVGLDGEAIGESPETRAAPAATPVDFEVKPDGTLIMGRYAPGGWQIASPGAYSAAGMSFGAPTFEDIAGLSGCGLARKDHDFFGAFAEETCTVTRSFAETDANGLARQATCTSTMKLTLAGAYSPVNGVMTYAPLDAKMFGQMQKGYEDALEQMKNLPGGGMPIPNPN